MQPGRDVTRGHVYVIIIFIAFRLYEDGSSLSRPFGEGSN